MAGVACPACRKVTRAATPAGLAGPCCYGPDVRAATALLACNGPMSIEHAADLMGGLLYISTARAGKLVWFGAAAGRGHAQLDAFGILPGYRGTLVRDDYAAYAKYDQHLTAVQLCCAHLIRALRGIGDLDEEGTRVQRCW